MSAKSTSPEAAQKKSWKAELKTLESARRKVIKEVSAEIRRSFKAQQDAAYAATKARRKHEQNCARLSKIEKRSLESIERRIGILRGRIGI